LKKQWFLGFWGLASRLRLAKNLIMIKHIKTTNTAADPLARAAKPASVAQGKQSGAGQAEGTPRAKRAVKNKKKV